MFRLQQTPAVWGPANTNNTPNDTQSFCLESHWASQWLYKGLFEAFSSPQSHATQLLSTGLSTVILSKLHKPVSHKDFWITMTQNRLLHEYRHICGSVRNTKQRYSSEIRLCLFVSLQNSSHKCHCAPCSMGCHYERTSTTISPQSLLLNKHLGIWTVSKINIRYFLRAESAMLSRAWIELGVPAWDVTHLSTPHGFKRPYKKSISSHYMKILTAKFSTGARQKGLDL